MNNLKGGMEKVSEMFNKPVENVTELDVIYFLSMENIKQINITLEQVNRLVGVMEALHDRIEVLEMIMED